MTLKKSNLGIHDVSKHLNQEIDSRLDQIIFNLGIRNVDKQHKAIGASVIGKSILRTCKNKDELKVRFIKVLKSIFLNLMISQNP